MPFALVGDLNVTPKQLQTTSFLCKVKASIVGTAEVHASCRSGRLLDDIVASSEIMSALAQVRFTPAPWKTYDVVTFKILRAPRQIQGRICVRPSRSLTKDTCSWQDAQAHMTQPQEPHQLGDPDRPLDGQATGMQQISDKDKPYFDSVMGRTRRIQRRLCASLGSGGVYSSIPQLRLCGWSWVLVGPQGDLSFSRYSPLEGPLQTVPRSDLAAVIYTLGHKPCELALEITLDAHTEQRNASRIHAPDRMDKSKAEGYPALFSDDGDLWTDFLQVLQKRSVTTSFVGCKSHATHLRLWSGLISSEACMANTYADAFAEQAAAMHQIFDEDKAGFDIIMGRARRIQKQLSAGLHIAQEFDANQIAERKAAIAQLPLAQRPKATKKYIASLVSVLFREKQNS